MLIELSDCIIQDKLTKIKVKLTSMSLNLRI